MDDDVVNVEGIALRAAPNIREYKSISSVAELDAKAASPRATTAAAAAAAAAATIVAGDRGAIGDMFGSDKR